MPLLSTPILMHPLPAKCRLLMLLASMLALSLPLAAEETSADVEQAPPPAATSDYVKIISVETAQKDDVYLLNCGATLFLPALPREALDSGFPLIFEHKIEIQRARRWWFDAVVLQANVRSRLEFLQLSRRYVVTRLHDGSRSSHDTLEAALQHTAILRDFPLIESHYIKTSSRYNGSISLSLDTESLPVPLRPQVYLSSDWRIKSDLFSWEIL